VQEEPGLQGGYPPPIEDSVSKKYMEMGREHRESRLGKVRSELVDKVGEELVKQAEENVATILANAKMQTRVPEAVVELILQDRFKSLFETTGKNNGAGAEQGRQYRAQTENKAIGLPIDMPLEYRPIYASFNTPGASDEGAARYGNVKITLKDRLRDRTTVSGDDNFYPGLTSSELNNFNVASLFKDGSDGISDITLKALSQAKTTEEIRRILGSNYIEAQIHGTVTPEDIVAIEYIDGTEPSQYVKEWMRANLNG